MHCATTGRLSWLTSLATSLPLGLTGDFDKLVQDITLASRTTLALPVLANRLC